MWSTAKPMGRMTFTSVVSTAEAAYAGSYAHPFFFNQPCKGEFSVSDLDRSEIGQLQATVRQLRDQLESTTSR